MPLESKNPSPSVRRGGMDLRGIRQMSLDDPHAIEREEDQVRFPDNSAPFESSPKTAVVAVIAVVSHHEKLFRPENDLFIDPMNRLRRLIVIHRLFNVRFVKLFAVSHYGIALHFFALPVHFRLFHENVIAGDPYEAFDEYVLFLRQPFVQALAVRDFRRFENDDVLALRFAESKYKFVDENVIVDSVLMVGTCDMPHQSVFHRLGGYEERLNKEGAND